MIAIIAILIGLLLPAVQKVPRGGGPRPVPEQPQADRPGLPQLRGGQWYLPPGILGDGANVQLTRRIPGPYVGCLAFILPYVEQQAVYSQLQVNWDVRKVSGPWWKNVPAKVAAAQTRIATYKCPSDDVEEVLQNPLANIAATIFYARDVHAYFRVAPIGTPAERPLPHLRGPALG